MFQLPKSQFSSIRRRIGLGYSIAIGVGFLSFITGLSISDYYQGQVIVQIANTQRQENLLANLKDTMLQLQIDNLELIHKTTQDPAHFQATRTALFRHLNKAKLLQADLEQFLNDKPTWLVVDQSNFQRFLHLTKTRLDAYAQLISELDKLEQTDSTNVSTALKTQLEVISTSSEVREMQQLLQELSLMLETANQQEYQARQAIEEVQGLEKLILVLSILLSFAISGIIIFHVTRSLTEPIIAICRVAEQAAEDANFTEEAVVDSADELGQLARALNQLIQRVAERTKELQTTADVAHAQAAYLQRSLTELRVTQTQLIQTEKMSSLGRLVGGIAHEINNPTTFIQGNLIYIQEYTEELLKFVQLCQDELSEISPVLQQQLDKIDVNYLKIDLPNMFASMQRGTDRIRDIVRSLQNFSRLDESGIKAIDLHESLESTLMLLKRRLRATSDRQPIQVLRDYGDLPLVECYAGELNQVLMHILTNALDAIDDYTSHATGQDSWSDLLKDSQDDWGRICIRTEKVFANQVRIQIANNGPNIPQEVQEHLFEPFYTTKPVGRGTGNGLFTSYQIIVEQHRGRLWCVSNPPRGAEFFIELPIQQRGEKLSV